MIPARCSSCDVLVYLRRVGVSFMWVNADGTRHYPCEAT